jgi:hypothetical protein
MESLVNRRAWLISPRRTVPLVSIDEVLQQRAVWIAASSFRGVSIGFVKPHVIDRMANATLFYVAPALDRPVPI